MSGRKTAPYGSWASPISLDLLLQGTAQMRNQMLRWDGDDLYWSELRPFEGGRIVVCKRGVDGSTSDVTPQGFNARSRVHEYGGGGFAVKDGAVFFTNFKDQRLYRQDSGGAAASHHARRGHPPRRHGRRRAAGPGDRGARGPHHRCA